MDFRSNIVKLYVSSFLGGLVFWYAIEKLFMASIGIDPLGVTIVGAIYVAILLIFDVPSGLLADRWSRKYCLILSAFLLALSSLVLGLSKGLPLYAICAILYGFNFVLYQGTIQAITYDTLYAICEQ